MADWESIEQCFLLCSSYWEKIREMLMAYSFGSAAEEIQFFRDIKTRFTSEMEYLGLLCQANMFQPEDLASRFRFWKRETQCLEEFSRRYPDFYHYYKSRKTNRDKQYYTRSNNWEGIFPLSGLYIEDKHCATGYDHLLACIIAREQYNEYALQCYNGLCRLEHTA